jgi:hypothetical protein
MTILEWIKAKLGIFDNPNTVERVTKLEDTIKDSCSRIDKISKDIRRAQLDGEDDWLKPAKMNRTPPDGITI